ARELRYAHPSIADRDQCVGPLARERRAVRLSPLVDRATQLRAAERLVDERDPLYPRRRRFRLDEHHASDGGPSGCAHSDDSDRPEPDCSCQSEDPSRFHWVPSLRAPTESIPRTKRNDNETRWL